MESIWLGRTATVIALAPFILQCSGQQTSAQQYPLRQITFIVAFAPGGVADTLARLIGKGLGERLQQTVVVENRGGAGGNIAAEVVAHANPDGYQRRIMGLNEGADIRRDPSRLIARQRL